MTFIAVYNTIDQNKRKAFMNTYDYIELVTAVTLVYSLLLQDDKG